MSKFLFLLLLFLFSIPCLSADKKGESPKKNRRQLVQKSGLGKKLALQESDCSIKEEFEIKLGPLLEPHLIDALKALFHTIFFNRSLGRLRLQVCEASCDTFDIIYAKAHDDDYDGALNDFIHQLLEKLKKEEEVLFLQLSFFNTREESKLLGIYKKIIESTWERWTIFCSLKPVGTHSSSKEAVEKEKCRVQELIKTKVLEVLTLCQGKQEHFPIFPMDLNRPPMLFNWKLSLPKEQKPENGFVRLLRIAPPQIFQ